MRPFSLLIKPAGASCNLRCEYCFYLHHLDPKHPAPRMSEEILEHLVKSYMETPQPVYGFAFQGGEPTLMGHKFYQKVVEFQKKFGKSRSQVANGFQTNGIGITDELGDLFHHYKFLVGVSMDGPPEIHNLYRKNVKGKPTHQMVMNGIKTLQKHQVEFNILTLVTQANVKRAKQVYRYLKKQEFYFHQYIPCVEWKSDNRLESFSITGEEWGQFLIDIFDEWAKEDIHRVSIRHLDSIVEFLVYGSYNVCQMGRSCNTYLVVEANGDVFPCDFFVRDDLKLGNIMENTWDELLNSELLEKFAQHKTKYSNSCRECEFLRFCNGDCQKFRSYSDWTQPSGLSSLCSGWQRFYEHALPPLKEIVQTKILNKG
ncbi:MAG: anaerobic sulfatase maturase [Promethearchaeota archaeon]|nr:MAG: anaerobic sulfatase maturase [Candidatus Lokiarchaeota archaeon]